MVGRDDRACLPRPGITDTPMRTPALIRDDLDSALSVQLRSQTSSLHAQVELLLGLPGAVRDRQDFCRLLRRFFGLYEPLERSFRRFDEWDSLGIALGSRKHAPALSCDLSALATDPCRVPRVPPGILPELPTFPHALGALYVLEGATLGGRVILAELEARIGPQIAGATRFLNGRGAATGPMWTSFRGALDCFGRARPELRDDVLNGAEDVFGAILAWFPSRDVEGRHP